MNKASSDRPIGVFDSGMGGISVLRELVRIMPNENYIYFGDSANAPYGTKTLEEVRALTCSYAKALFEEGAKGLVVACNTATSAAVRVLREQYPHIPIVGIEPAVKPASQCKEHPRVLVMATPMTIREAKFKNLMAQYEDEADIIPLPCPGLMDFVERGDLDGEDLRKYLVELLFEYRQETVDAVVLGCTHYPFVKDMIQKTLGADVLVFDGGEGTAKEMKRRLGEAGLLTSRTGQGNVEFRNSLKSEEKLRLCRKLFEM
jgi:glutamate racemase